MHITGCAVTRCPAVYPSHACMVSEWLNISNVFDRRVTTPCHFAVGKRYDSIPMGMPYWGHRMQMGIKITIFDQYLALSWRWYKLLWIANRKPYPSFRMVRFQLPWMTPSPDYLMLNISEMVRDTDIVTVKYYTCRTQGCHFEWPWVTSAQYSMTRSIVRSLWRLSFLFTKVERKSWLVH